MENGFTHFDTEWKCSDGGCFRKDRLLIRTALATGYIAVGPEIMASSNSRKCQKRRCPWRSQSCRDHGSEKNFRADSHVSSAADTEMFH